MAPAGFQLNPARLEVWLLLQYALGASFIAGNRYLKKRANSRSQKINDSPEKKALLQRLAIELARKSFHIIGGTTIVFWYYWSMKLGWTQQAWHLGNIGPDHHQGPPNAAYHFAPVCVGIWALEFIRMLVPAVNHFLLSFTRGVVREKEQNQASGMSFFLPGALFAMIAYPPDEAMLSIMYLTLGDAAAGLGTAVGKWKVGQTTRKLEGTVGFAAIAFLMGCVLIDGVGSTGTHVCLAALAAVGAALSELWAEVIKFDDNLFVPVVGGFVLHYLVHVMVIPGHPSMRSKLLLLLGDYLPLLQGGVGR